MGTAGLATGPDDWSHAPTGRADTATPMSEQPQGKPLPFSEAETSTRFGPPPPSDAEDGAWDRVEADGDFNLTEATDGRYLYIREIGSGGMGRVLLAHDSQLGRDVAVKVLRREMLADRDRMERFIHEARITAQLVHPGIVPVFDIGQDHSGRHFFVMQVVSGVTLREMLAKARMGRGIAPQSLTHILRIFHRVCETVAYAHAQGIVHRDLKPGNIMVGTFGEVLVMDWGLAKRTSVREEEPGPSPIFETAGSERTEAGRVHGTPGYMSPEQASAAYEAMGPASDVFSLGIILHEILTGERPFHGTDLDDVVEALRRDRREAVRELTRARKERSIPNALVAICDKALSLNPPDRYPTAKELADDLDAHFQNRDVSAFQAPIHARLTRFLHNHPSVAAVAIGVLLTLAGAAGVSTVNYIAMQPLVHEVRNQVVIQQERFVTATRRVNWLRRRLESPDIDLSPSEQEDLEREMRMLQQQQLVALQGLTTTLREMFVARPRSASAELGREFRYYWLEEINLMLDREDERLVTQAYEQFARMQRERQLFPWWNWQENESWRLEELRYRIMEMRRRFEQDSGTDSAPEAGHSASDPPKPLGPPAP
jgi:serine/threonine protein kinase